ncbi:MAG: hypothetical protein A2Y38_16300 [Spirochaetes bacterium GWB1_59_5]|nr:MAG: hypothetical protein A2Y38_16300 [Spirochaetes bacterium GWB1_59_5]
MCPVYFVQASFNYDQSDNALLERCLNHLVDEDGICQMKKTLEKLNLLNPELADDRSELEKWESERVGGLK